MLTFNGRRLRQMAEIDEKLAELEGFSDYIREYQVSLVQINNSAVTNSVKVLFILTARGVAEGKPEHLQCVGGESFFFLVYA